MLLRPDFAGKPANFVYAMVNAVLFAGFSAVSVTTGMVMAAPAGAEEARASFNFSPAAYPPSYKGKRTVSYRGGHKPGTVVIDTGDRTLLYILKDGQAIEYGVGVGRNGFEWKGSAHIGNKATWPTWTPPPDMRKRHPGLPVSMPGGPKNPLGARALYLFKGGRDTLYRIHGTDQPSTIGMAISSGCIRMLNEEVIDLYKRVRVGTSVVVL